MEINLKKLREELVLDEGLKYEIYLDSDANATFGIGHLIVKSDPEFALIKKEYPFLFNALYSIEQKKELFKKAPKISIENSRVEEAYKNDINATLMSCRSCLPNFNDYDDEPKRIIANMIFNLGQDRFKGFAQLNKDLKEKNFKMAAKEMQYKNGRKPQIGLSDWYAKTKDRAVRLVARMENYANDYLCNLQKTI